MTEKRVRGARRALSPTEAKRLHREWRHRTARPLSMVLDNVQTPYNVGSIVRTAASFRVEHLYIVGKVPVTPDHPKSQKTSLGTERLLSWSEHESVDDAFGAAREVGHQLVGVELASGGHPLMDVDWSDAGVCIVLGHEDRGLSAAALSACDAIGYVPTPGKVGSLNVAIAAGIALYEARRAEWTATT